MTTPHGWVVAALVALSAQTLPPAYPRPGASTLIENQRVVVWNIAWLKGEPSPLHRHLYDLTEEQAGVTADATVFELK